MESLQDKAIDETSEASRNSSKANHPPTKDSVFDNRSKIKKIIRVVTVMAYLTSVSFVAIALSGYYVFLWQPSHPRLTSRAHTISEAQMLNWAENSPIHITVDENKINTIEKFGKGNSLKNEISRHRNMNVTSHKLFQANKRKSNDTDVPFVYTMITQTHRNKNVKNTPDARISVQNVYGFLNDQINISIEKKNLKTSMLITRMPNANRIIPTNHLAHSTEKKIKMEQANSVDNSSLNSGHSQQYIHNSQLIGVNEVSFDGKLEADDSHYVPAMKSKEESSIAMSFTERIESFNIRDSPDETTQTPSQSYTKLLFKRNSTHLPSSVYIKVNGILGKQREGNSTVAHSPTMPFRSNIHVKEMKSNEQL